MPRFHDFQRVIPFILLLAVPMSARAEGAEEKERLDAEELYRTGLKAFSSGDYAAATKHFSEFVSRYAEEPVMQKSMPKAVYVLGCSWYNVRRMDEAIEALEDYLKRAPEGEFRADVLFRLANACQVQGEYAKAITTYEQLLHDFPDFEQAEDARFQIAVCYLAQEKYKDAIPVLKSFQRRCRNPRIADAATAYLIRCLYLTGQYDDALERVKAVTKKGAPSDHLILMSSIALQLGDHFYDDFEYDKSLDAYRCVVRREEMLSRQKKRLEELGKERSTIQNASRQNAMSVAELERLSSLISQVESQLKTLEERKNFDTAWLMRLGRCLYEMGALWESSVVFQEIKQAFPNSEVTPEACASLIYCLTQMRLYEKSNKEIDEFIAKYPKHPKTPELAFLKAESYVNQEKFADAERELKHLLEKYPGIPNKDRAEFYLHLSQAMQEKFEDAQAGLARWLETKAYADSAVAPDVAYWYCMATFFAGDYSNAMPRLNAFLKKYADSSYVPDVEYRIAVGHYMQERYRDAALALVKFVRAHTNHPMICEAQVLRGDALAAMGELPIAVKAYSEAGPESGPYYHYAVAQIGKCYKMMENYSNMVSVYETYIDNVPDSPNVVEGLYWLGWAYRQEGNLVAARDAYWDALSRFGNKRDWGGFEDIIRDLNKMYAGSNGMIDLEIRLKEEAGVARSRGKLTLGSRLDAALCKLAAWLDRGDEAAELLEKFRARYSTNVLGADGLIFLARGALEAGDKEKAEPYFRQIAEQYSQSPLAAEAELRLAQAARAKGDVDAARELLNSAEEKANDVRIALEIALDQGHLCLADDMPRQAIKKFEEVLANRAARGPLWPQALFGVATAYEELRDYGKAVPYYQRIYVMYAGYTNLAAKAYYHSGRCFERLQDSEAAVNSYRELLADERLSSLPEAAFAEERLRNLTGTAALEGK